MTTSQLTDFQLNEVQGLLDICNDEVALAAYNDWEPDRTPWGTIEGNMLTVTDSEDAVDDLEDRAMFFVEEGPRHTACELAGQGASRSLRSLIKKIEGKA